ncbi:hypothetical protein EG829_02635 [bacterium]|nr:hypothetical protein [bacterium]
MTERRNGTESVRRPLRVLPQRVLVVVSVVVFSIYLLYRVLLITPYPAYMIGNFLTDYTGCRVEVAGLAMINGAVSLSGVTIENPHGFREREMVSIRSLTLSPDVAGLLTGKRSLSLLEIDGLRLDFVKSARGEWNFATLVRRFTAKKEQPSREVMIRRLSLRNVSLRVNGHAVEGLGLTIDDLSTRGTSASRLVLTARDPDGNPVHLTAEGRMGPSPAFRIRLAAPALSIAPLVKPPAKGFPLELDQAASLLDITVDYRGAILVAHGKIGFDGLRVRLGSGMQPLRGAFDFAGSYDTSRDEARLETASLAVNGRVTLRASGSMQRVRKAGDFVLRLSHDSIGLADLLIFLPGKLREGLALEGTLASRGLRLEGNRIKGITACDGDISIRSLRLVRNGRLLFRDGAADLSPRRMADGWRLSGRLFTAARGSDSLVESLDAPFTARFTPRFKPESVELPVVTAAIMGGTLKGNLRYLFAPRPRFIGECSASKVPLAALNSYLAATTAQFKSGSGFATASMSGASPLDFTGRVSATLSAASGTVNGRPFSVRAAQLISTVRRGTGGFSADGGMKVTGGVLGDRPFSASFDLSLAGQNLKIRNADLILERDRARIESATVRLPLAGKMQPGGGLPLNVTVAGAGFRSGDLVLAGLAGDMDCRYVSSAAERRLEGVASVTVGSLTYRERKVASLAGRIVFGGRDATARVRGESLGGSLDASITASPFSSGKETSFSLKLREQHLERLSTLLSEKNGPQFSGGRADVFLEGSYSRTAGILGRISLTGSDLALRGTGNRTLITGVGINLDSRVTGKDLNLREVVLSRSGGPALRLSGEVKRFAYADRSGGFTFVMAATPLNSLLDAFANTLPRNLQDAVGEGTCALEGKAEVKGRNLQLQGNVALDVASLEMPSQKVLVTGINGRVPFATAFPSQEPERKASSQSFSRENYSKLLQALGRSAGTGSPLRIGKARFGALEVGAMSFFITAHRGLLEIAPLRVSLYDGSITGNGFIQYGNGFRYGADFLLHDLSLRQFCDTFPKIKGYMSGRVDGVISLLNVQGGLGGMAGYVNLWTRSGKGEKMLVSKEFLQKLAGKKLQGFLFQNDRAYDNGEIIALLQNGFLTFERLDISHTNFLGMKDLSVSVAPVQNRIAIGHLLESVREAAARGKGTGGEAETPPIQTDLKWLE